MGLNVSGRLLKKSGVCYLEQCPVRRSSARRGPNRRGTTGPTVRRDLRARDGTPVREPLCSAGKTLQADAREKTASLV